MASPVYASPCPEDEEFSEEEEEDRDSRWDQFAAEYKAEHSTKKRSRSDDDDYDRPAKTRDDREPAPSPSQDETPNLPPPITCPQCFQQLTARESRSSNNPGRLFYGHFRDDTCRYFKWVDQRPGDPSPPPRTSTFPCKKCGTALYAKVSRSEKNPNRQFYKCDPCDWFSWVDQVNRNATRSNSTPPNNNNNNYSPPPPNNNNNNNNNNNTTATATMPCRNCGAVLNVKTSRSERNPGRQFYKCDGCNIFTWADATTNTTNSRSPRGGRGQGQNTNRCFRCGQAGHWARDCPNT